jgi:hypothetical protein
MYIESRLPAPQTLCRLRRREPCEHPPRHDAHPFSNLRLLRFDGHRLRETTESQSPMNEPVTASKKSRQKFDPAFKQQAVALWLNSNKAGSAVAAELATPPPIALPLPI